MKNLLVSALLLCLCINAFPCTEVDTEGMLQMLFFRASLPGMEKDKPFFYTPDMYNSGVDMVDDTADKVRNIKEWQLELGKDVKYNDIETALYNIPTEKMLIFLSNKQIPVTLKQNSFIKKLYKKENAELLNYFRIAKQIEAEQENYSSRFESWQEVPQYTSIINNEYYYYNDNTEDNFKTGKYTKYLKLIAGEVSATKSSFLRQRYGFQLCRIYYYSGMPKECVNSYIKYFGKPNPESLMNNWALYFCALMSNNAQYNYYLSLARTYCDSKDNISVMLLKRNTSDMESALSLAKSNIEKANLIAINCLQQSGPCLPELTKIAAYNPNTPDLPFLLLREINKLEDWLYSSGNAEYDDYSTKASYTKYLEANKTNDLQYLSELCLFTQKLEAKTTYKNKDFYRAAIAHLYFMQDDAKNANVWIHKITANANASIKQQMLIDQLLIAGKTQNIESESFKQLATYCILRLNKQRNTLENTDKILYSITNYLGNLYLKKQDKVTASLLFLHSDNYKYSARYFTMDSTYLDYRKIAMLDTTNSIAVVDKMIALKLKKQKTAFENYLLESSTDIYYYYDLKGTIAFRQNKLSLAYNTFIKIPAHVWKRTQYKDYLNENPFLPKCLDKHRKFNYQFNKASFVKTLIDYKAKALLMPAKSDYYYLQLAHAYYNCSKYGNSWLMTQYYWSDFDENNNNLYDNYYNLTIAKQYYKLAWKNSKNTENLAMALLMLGECDMYSGNDFYGQSGLKAYYFTELLSKYANTKTVKQYHCPLMNEFVPTRFKLKK